MVSAAAASAVGRGQVGARKLVLVVGLGGLDDHAVRVGHRLHRARALGAPQRDHTTVAGGERRDRHRVHHRGIDREPQRNVGGRGLPRVGHGHPVAHHSGDPGPLGPHYPAREVRQRDELAAGGGAPARALDQLAVIVIPAKAHAHPVEPALLQAPDRLAVAEGGNARLGAVPARQARGPDRHIAVELLLEEREAHPHARAVLDPPHARVEGGGAALERAVGEAHGRGLRRGRGGGGRHGRSGRHGADGREHKGDREPTRHAP